MPKLVTEVVSGSTGSQFYFTFCLSEQRAARADSEPEQQSLPLLCLLGLQVQNHIWIVESFNILNHNK